MPLMDAQAGTEAKLETHMEHNPGHVEVCPPTAHKFSGDNDEEVELFEDRRMPGFWSDLATIIVGKSRTHFICHLTPLTSVSKFFRAAFQAGRFRESLDHTVTLPEERPSVVEYFCAWLYTRQLPTIYFRDNKGTPVYGTLVRLYGLADRLDVPALRNTIITTIAQLAQDTNSVLNPLDTRMLYEETSEGSTLRRLAVDLFVYTRTLKLLETDTRSWDPEFLRDVLIRIMKPSQEAKLHSIQEWNFAIDGLPCHPYNPLACPQHSQCPQHSHNCVGPTVANPNRYICMNGCGLSLCEGCHESGRNGSIARQFRQLRVGDNASFCKPWTMQLCERFHEHPDGLECRQRIASLEMVMTSQKTKEKFQALGGKMLNIHT